MTSIPRFLPTRLFPASFVTVLAVFRSRAALQLEILALRHQIDVLQRSVQRPKLTAADGFLRACRSRLWAGWRVALVLVEPATVIAWHRKGFRLFWSWKVRRGQAGSPTVSREARDLIRKMSRENPLWGAPRIHGELLRLGFAVSEGTVARYLRRSTPVAARASGGLPFSRFTVR